MKFTGKIAPVMSSFSGLAGRSGGSRVSCPVFHGEMYIPVSLMLVPGSAVGNISTLQASGGDRYLKGDGMPASAIVLVSRIMIRDRHL